LRPRVREFEVRAHASETLSFLGISLLGTDFGLSAWWPSPPADGVFTAPAYGKPDLLNKVDGNYQYLSDDQGALTRYAYAAGTTAGVPPLRPRFPGLRSRHEHRTHPRRGRL
jgi:hypothetical protein